MSARPATTAAAEVPAGAQDEEILVLRGIAKAFGVTRALRDASLAIRRGEVHAIVGENGSGKSTLVKVLSGVHRPDGGTIAAGGAERRFRSPAGAFRAGIATVYQEVLTVGPRSVVENVFYGSEGLLRGARSLDAKRAQARAILTEVLGESPDLDTPVEELSLSDRQACSIARAVVREPRVLVLDESTSALDVATRDRLFALLRRRVGQGMSVIFISHRMDEISELADRVTVLRSGESVDTLSRAQATPERLVRLMTGGDRLVDRQARPTQAVRPEVALSATGIRLADDRPPVDLEIMAGELVGLAGLEGHGQDLLLRALWRLVPLGEVTVLGDGGHVPIRTPAEATARGVAYVPRERRDEGLFESMSIAENFALPTLGHDGRLGLFRPGRSSRRLRGYVDRLQIKLGGEHDPITTLSGGNQQKVVLARWLATEPRVLLLNDPTRGIDLGAKRDLYAVLGQLAEAGLAVVMLSTELDEHVELMDRVLVLRDQALAADIPRAALTREALVGAFFGTARGE